MSAAQDAAAWSSRSKVTFLLRSFAHFPNSQLCWVGCKRRLARLDSHQPELSRLTCTAPPLGLGLSFELFNLFLGLGLSFELFNT